MTLTDVASRLALIPAQHDDFEALATLRLCAMRESLERLGRYDAERSRARFGASFSAAHTRHIVCDGQRIGFVALTPQPDVILLDHLYVHPEQQAQGVGSAVLQAIFLEVDALGLPLRVGALKESESNRFYTRHGFVPVGSAEWDNYYERAPLKLA